MNILKQYGGFFLLAFAIGLLILTNLPKPSQTTTLTGSTTFSPVTNSTPTSTTTAVIYVEIKGAVRFPGVYRMEAGSRLFELIGKAGGLSSNADIQQINQTVFLTDSSVVMIPFILQTSVTTTTTTTNMTTGMITIQLKGAVKQPGTYVIPSGTTLRSLIALAQGLLIEAKEEGLDLDRLLAQNQTIDIPFRVAVGTLININTATVDELAILPGIGTILGQRIVDYRAEFGPFEQIEDIMKVSGIKQSVYEKIRDLIRT